MSRSLRPLAGLLLLSSLVATGVVACGSDDDEAASAGDASGGDSVSGDEIPPGITLRVGEQSPIGELSFELAGLDDDLPYEIEYVRFESGPLTNEGLAAEAIDLGSMGDNPAIGAAATGLPVTVIGVTTSDGPGILLVARPGSGIATLEDLEGKKVAFTTGTAQHGLVLRALDSVGLEQSDVEQVDVPLQDLATVLESGDADASVLSYESEVTYKEAHPDAVRLLSSADVGGAGGYTLALDASLADPGKRAAILDYLERRVEAQGWINTHPDVWSEEYYVKERKQTPENARIVIEGNGTTTYRPIDDELQSSLQELADLLHGAGGLDAEVDISAIYDPEVIDEYNAIVDRVDQS